MTGFRRVLFRSNFGYSHAYLEEMKSQSFWEAQFASIEGIDAALTAARKL